MTGTLFGRARGHGRVQSRFDAPTQGSEPARTQQVRWQRRRPCELGAQRGQLHRITRGVPPFGRRKPLHGLDQHRQPQGLASSGSP